MTRREPTARFLTSPPAGEVAGPHSGPAGGGDGTVDGGHPPTRRVTPFRGDLPRRGGGEDRAGRRRVAFVLLAALPLMLGADAPGGLGYTPPAPPPAPDPAGLVVRLFLMTGGAIAACGGVVWLARRANRLPPVPADSAGRLILEGSLPLPRRCSVHLVRADGHTVAVTTDATGLRSLVLLSEPFQTMLDEAGR